MSLSGRILALAFAGILASASSAAPQAWLQWDQSAATIGRGGAVAGVAEDASAAFYNPAGIVSLFGTHVRVDGVASRSAGEFHAFGARSFDREPDLDLAGALYATHAVAEDLAIGLSVNAPWRRSTDWERPGEFPGRFRSTAASLRSVVLSPVLAWRALPDVAVAAGPTFTYGVLDLDRFEQDPELSALGGAGPIALARSRYALDGVAPGWVVGLSWRIDDALAIGLHARGGVDLDLVGPVEFEDVAPDELRDFVLRLQDSVTVGEILDERYVAQQVVATTSLPTLVSGGVAWSPVERLRLTGDLQWFGWEEAGSIGLDFVDDSLDDRLTFDYDDDTWSIRTGVEVRHRPGQVVRLGFAHVESPTSRRSLTPVLPDSDRDEISAGVGLVWRGVQLDLAYRIAFLSDREGVALPGDPSPDGVYESTEQALAVGIARRF